MLSKAFGYGDFFISKTTDNASESVNVLFDEKYKKKVETASSKKDEKY